MGWVEDTIISNNFIYDLQGNGGNRFAGIFAVMYDIRQVKSPLPSENETPKNLIITNNIIKKLNYSQEAYYCGIKTSANGTIISNNIIQDLHNGDNTETSGIYLYTLFNSPFDIQIQNNRLKGCYPSGIYLQYARNCLIQGNVFETDSEGTNDNFGNRYAICIENGYGITIDGNLFRSTHAQGILQTHPSNLLSYLSICNNTFNNSSLNLYNAVSVNVENNIFTGSYQNGQPAINFNFSAVRRLINIIGNQFNNLDTAPAISLNNITLSNINNNMFGGASYPIFIQNSSSKININSNVSWNTLNPSFVAFSNVSSANQETIIRVNNIDDK